MKLIRQYISKRKLNSMKKKIVVAHPTGNANTRGAINGFNSLKILHSFHTCVACFEGSALYKLSAIPLFREFRRRMFDKSLQTVTYTYPFKELMRMVAVKLKRKDWLAHETGRYCVDKIYQDLDRKVARFVNKHHGEIEAVYLYEDCATEIVKAAKAHKLKCIYDLPIGYWRAMRRLLDDERQKNPDWAMTLGGFNDSDEKLMRKDNELCNADKIYVASSFTKETLKDYPGKLVEIEVIPYGFPPVNKHRKYVPLEGRKLKVLFVGGLSQRKGLSYLFNAVKGLEDKVELTVIGQGNTDECLSLQEALSRVNYIPSLPHDEVLKVMADNDLFVFPSLFEGFGLVITEAMSQGTPVITTERTCGPDIITNGVDGWIVNAGESGEIRKLLLALIEKPNLLVEAGKNALKTALKRPWEIYEKELAESVNTFIND